MPVIDIEVNSNKHVYYANEMVVSNSHSYSYAYTSYYQAYQKKFFPTEFFVSSLNFSNEKIDPKLEIYELIQDALLHNIKVTPPDLQLKNDQFEIINDNTIAFGLGHIRGVGSKGIEKIQKIDKFTTFDHFIKSSKSIKRNVAESLIKSGACDFYKLSRTYMLRVLQTIYGHTVRNDQEDLPLHLRSLSTKELDFFLKNIDNYGITGTLQRIISEEICIAKRINVIQQKIQFLSKQDLTDTNTQKSIWEKLYLGLNITCSAADDFAKVDPNVKSCKQAHFIKNKEKITIHCVIDDISVRKTSEKSKTPR